MRSGKGALVPVIVVGDAVLFDLDGVLVDSVAVIRRHWGQWALRHGLDVGQVLAAIAGRPAREAIRVVAPGLEVEAELRVLEDGELSERGDVRATAGAAELLGQLPRGRWGIVTSATAAVARARLAESGLPRPCVLVSADDVERGKPEPEGLLRAAAELGVAPSRCVVVEDAAAGIAAARAAGMQVIHVGPEGGGALLADHHVGGLDRVGARLSGGGLELLERAAPVCGDGHGAGA